MSVEVLNVERRETRGKHNAKRMRAAGQIPAVLYGHQQESIALTLAADQLVAAIRRRAHLFELKGGVKESALIKEVQWDAFGTHVLHVDLTRVDLTEAVEVAIQVLLRGVAPGTKQGGVVEQNMRELIIECPANAIPESLVVNINELDVDQSILVGKIELPKGAKLLAEADAIVCHCFVPAVVDEEEAGAESMEPEVIGRKEEDESESAS